VRRNGPPWSDEPGRRHSDLWKLAPEKRFEIGTATNIPVADDEDAGYAIDV
jgi:hypothetical protein